MVWQQCYHTDLNVALMYNFPFELIIIAKLELQYLELLYIALFAHLANYSTLQIQFDAKSTLGDSLQPVAFS